MIHRIEVSFKSNLPDPRGGILLRDIHDLGINTVSRVRVIDVYHPGDVEQNRAEVFGQLDQLAMTLVGRDD